MKLLKEINKQALKHGRIIDCLLQVHVAEEETKFGLKADELHQMLSSEEFKELKNIKIKGLMSMATFTQDQSQIKAEFGKTKALFDTVKTKKLYQNSNFDTISVGMSGDFELAIEEGSNMVRLGSVIFGRR